MDRYLDRYYPSLIEKDLREGGQYYDNVIIMMMMMMMMTL
jgi:hypothetical protein